MTAPASSAPVPSPLPPVAVVMAVYNGEAFLSETLDSILRQTFTDFELVVVDDGSTDMTPQILDAYAAGDSRVVVLRQHNQGRAAALNDGVAAARAPLIARIDADDIATPRRLELQREYLDNHPEVAVVGGSVTFIDDGGRAFAESAYPFTPEEVRAAVAAMRTPLAHPAAMIRKKVFVEVGGYRPVFVDADDVDLWLRILDHHELANVPEVVVRYRIHRRQASVVGMERQALCCVAAHVAARARRAGLADPVDAVDHIDAETVIAWGGTREEITAFFVESATWLARTSARAGYGDIAKALFAMASLEARSEAGSPKLIADVHKARARHLAERGRRFQAKVEAARAVIAARAATARPDVAP
jgi:hypothetical protein